MLAYTSPLSAMMPFSLGALIYFKKKNIRSGDIPRKYKLVIPVLLILIYCLPVNFYFALLVNGAAIFCLSLVDAANLPKYVKGIDHFFGNLTYPVFLLHILSSDIIRLLFPEIKNHTWELYLIGFGFANLLAMVVYYSIEYPVDFFRRRIKNLKET